MDDHDAWARLLAAAGRGGAGSTERICRLCVDALGVTGAGIARTSSPGTGALVCASDDVAARVEDLQLVLGEGPCVDAMLGGVPVLIPDLAADDDDARSRWPAFLERADAIGVRAVFAFPLRIGAMNVGTMDLYRDAPGELTPGQMRGGLMAASAAAVAMLHASTGLALAPANDPGGVAAHQVRVHQATGMVQVQLGISTEEAFLVLRARAFATERPLAAVARDVVERRHRFTEGDR